MTQVFRIWTGWAWAVTGGRAGKDGPRPVPEKPRKPERESKFTVKFFTLQFFAHFSSLAYVAFILGRQGRRSRTRSLTLEMEMRALFNFQNESSQNTET